MFRPVDAMDFQQLDLQLLDLLPAAVYVCEAPSGVILQCNRRAVELWGREPCLGDPDERFCASFRVLTLDGRSVARDETPMAAVLRTGEAVRNQEAVVERPDGSRFTALVNIDPIRDADGRLVGAVNVFQDVTELHAAREVLRRQRDEQRSLAAHTEELLRAEQALRESEVLFRNLADSAPVLIWMSDAQKRGVYFNRVWLEFTGRTLEEELGDGWTTGVHPDDQVYLATCAEAFQERRPFTTRFRLRSATGEYRWMLDTGVPRFAEDGAFAGYVGSCVDITERKRNEEAQLFIADASRILAASLDYETTLQHLAHLLVPYLADWCTVHVVQADGSVSQVAVAHMDEAKVAWARQLEKRWAYDPDAPSGVPRVIRTAEVEIYSEITDEMLVAGARDAEQLEVLRSVGLTSCMILPLRSQGRTLGAMSLFAAESGRRYGPEDLPLVEDLAYRAATAIENARLYREAQEALEAAQASQAALAEADRRKDEFLAMLAHELRNPLSPILSATEVLKLCALELPAARRQRDIIERQARHMARLLDDLLDVSRITRNKIELRREPINLRTIVEHAVEAAQPQLESRGHRVEVRLTPEPVPLLADPARVAQVVSNLLHNAAKYTPDGGRIWVEVDVRPSSLDPAGANGRTATGTLSPLGNESGAGEAVLTVRDTGIGIAPDLLPQVFDLFTQGQRSLARSDGGLGIGLTLVKRLVEMHGGSVTVASTGPGQGSTFTVRLPMATSPSGERPVRAAAHGEG